MPFKSTSPLGKNLFFFRKSLRNGFCEFTFFKRFLEEELPVVSAHQYYTVNYKRTEITEGGESEEKGAGHQFSLGITVIQPFIHGSISQKLAF